MWFCTDLTFDLYSDPTFSFIPRGLWIPEPPADSRRKRGFSLHLGNCLIYLANQLNTLTSIFHLGFHIHVLIKVVFLELPFLSFPLKGTKIRITKDKPNSIYYFYSLRLYSHSWFQPLLGYPSSLRLFSRHCFNFTACSVFRNYDEEVSSLPLSLSSSSSSLMMSRPSDVTLKPWSPLELFFKVGLVAEKQEKQNLKSSRGQH